MAIQRWTTSLPVCHQASADECPAACSRRAEFARTAVRVPWHADDAEDVTSHGGPDAVPCLAMRLLAAGVPLSLLIDLVSPEGPDSERIAEAERTAAA